MIRELTSRFPAESEPDGARFACHHFLYPLYALLLSIYTWGVHAPLAVTGVVVALSGWFHFWKWYPSTGATLSLLGWLTAFCGVLVAPLSLLQGVFLVGCLLYSLDDWISHALGLPTPLDYTFNEYIGPYLP